MNDYLEHYGVKGQRKGKRRYQNEDGSYTEEGRRHYGIGERREASRAMGVSGVAQGVRPNSKTASTVNKKPQKVTKEQAEARKNKTKKILAAVGGLTLAAAIGYGIYKSRNKPNTALTAYKGSVRRRTNSKQVRAYLNSVRRLPARASLTLGPDEFRIT